MTRTKPIILLLAFAAIFFAILMPPEAYPTGQMVVVLSSTFVFLGALTERKIPYRFLIAGLTIFPLLFIHSLLVSVDLNRSLEFLTVLWSYYCLLGFFLYSSHDSVDLFAGAIVVLSLIVSGYGLYQYFYGFDQLYNFVSYSGSADVIKVPALETIATRRVFSTLALPGTLWGFLVIALPIHGILWRRHRLLDAALILSAVLLLATGLLTRSFGFVIGLFLLILGAALIQLRTMVWRHLGELLAVIVILSTLGGAFYMARRQAIEQSNPVVLRAKNWLSAWSIFAANPLGTGLNTYGVVYPQFMQSDANETQYAHNTPLQLLSELGYPGLLAAIAFVLFVTHVTKSGIVVQGKRCLLLALMVWVVHNMIDIDIYFPSVGVVGIVLLGILFARPQKEHAQFPSPVLAGFIVMAVCALGFSGLVLVSGELQHRAQAEYENSKPAVALATLTTAQKFNPLNSSLFHDYGEIALDLHHKTKDQQYLERSTESFQRAIKLSPLKSGPHMGLGLCLSTANKMDDALQELWIAQQLFPSSDYVRSVARLLENRVAK
jgi:hypothetical protein